MCFLHFSIVYTFLFPGQHIPFFLNLSNVFSSVNFTTQNIHFRKEKKKWNVVESQIHFSAECCLLSTNLTNCGGHFLFILPISVNLPSCVSKSDFFSQELKTFPTCILSIPSCTFYLANSIFAIGSKRNVFFNIGKMKS